jgi:hypothetical protein
MTLQEIEKFFPLSALPLPGDIVDIGEEKNYVVSMLEFEDIEHKGYPYPYPWLSYFLTRRTGDSHRIFLFIPPCPSFPETAWMRITDKGHREEIRVPPKIVFSPIRKLFKDEDQCSTWCDKKNDTPKKIECFGCQKHDHRGEEFSIILPGIKYSPKHEYFYSICLSLCGYGGYFAEKLYNDTFTGLKDPSGENDLVSKIYVNSDCKGTKLFPYPYICKRIIDNYENSKKFL